MDALTDDTLEWGFWLCMLVYVGGKMAVVTGSPQHWLIPVSYGAGIFAMVLLTCFWLHRRN